MRGRVSRGFTLLEAMVVVILLGALLALLVPYLRTGGRVTSRRSQCASNLSQIGKAAAMYADVSVNLGHYPDDGVSAMGSLNVLYGGYIKDARVFSCPSAPTNVSGLADYLQPNYRSNLTSINNAGGFPASSYGYDRRHNPTHAVAGLASDFKDASDKPGVQGNSTGHGTSDGHGLGQYFLACDGHVEWLENAEIDVNGVMEHIFRDDTGGKDGLPLDEDTWIRGD